ncbi:MAG: SpoIIE family protein phosphatase [Spirochaetota bacterium]
MIFINIISPLVAAIFLLVISFFVIVKDWRSQLTKYYIYYNISSIGLLLTLFLTYAYPEYFDLTLLNKITQMFAVIFFGSFFAVSIVYPKSESGYSFLKVILMLFPSFIAGAVIVATNITISKAYFENDILIREFTPYYKYYAVLVFMYLFAGIINFIRKYIKIKIRIYKLQMRYVFIGVSVALVFAIFFSIILPLVFNNSALYTVGPALGGFISAVALFYAVIAYDLMGIRIAVLRSVIYVIQSILIIAPIAAIMILYHNKSFIFSETPSYLISAIIVLIFIVFSINIQPFLDRILQRPRYAFEKLLNNLIREIQYIKNVEEVVTRVVDILHGSVFIKNIFAMLLNRNTKNFELFYFKGQNPDIKPIDINSQVIRWFVRYNMPLNMDKIYIEEEIYGEIREDILNLFRGLDVKIILPLFNDKQITGLVCLGEKSSMASYKSDEIAILRQFNNESNVYITNAIDHEEWSKGQLVSGILDLSSEILSKAVPVNLPKIPEILFGAFYIPRYREGIDYFDFITPTNIGAGVIATDISGRGINNALYSVILRSAFHSCIEDAHSTYTIMQKLNRALFTYAKDEGGIVKAYYFYYNIYTMRLIYTNAGFQPLEIYRVEKNIYESMDTEGFPLGTDISTNYGMGRTNLLVGDIGFLYSRSFIESKNQKGEKFGLTQLRKIIKENRRRHPSEITSILKEEYHTFMGLSSPESNVLVIIFKV